MREAAFCMLGRSVGNGVLGFVRIGFHGHVMARWLQRYGKDQANLTLLIWLAKTFWQRCISFRHDSYKGTCRMKLLDSNEIRTLRDACVFEINGMEVFM